jgi:hypothetical protein
MAFAVAAEPSFVELGKGTAVVFRSFTLKSSRLVDLWAIQYCLSYFSADGVVSSPSICIARLRSLIVWLKDWSIFKTTYKLPATPAHRLLYRIMRVLLNLGR